MSTNCPFDEMTIGSILITKQSRTKLVNLCYISQNVAKYVVYACVYKKTILIYEFFLQPGACFAFKLQIKIPNTVNF